MVKRYNFRIGCLVVGFIGFVLILISDGEKLLKAIGMIVCILLMIFGFVVTGKWGKLIMGKEVDDENPDGAMG